MYNEKQRLPYGARPVDHEKFLGKQLPANLEAERSVLGALLLNDEYLSRVVEIIHADDFYSPQHKIIYQTITLNLNGLY